MTKEELNYALIKLKGAIDKLEEGTEIAKDELGEDGVIQRFEFSFELSWKTLKIFLRDKGINVMAPRDILKEAFKLEWLESEEVFLDMLEDRNKASHVYSKQTSREIFKRIKDKYIFALRGVSGILETLLSQRS